ncbi:hypothetical protein [Spirosoma aerophilum]
MTTDTNLNADTTPQIRYSENGRSGTIYYTNHEISFDVWYEFAMPPALVLIGIPEPRHWEAQTNTPLSERPAILDFIGNSVIKDKLQSGAYARIEQDNIMTIYTGKDPDLDS